MTASRFGRGSGGVVCLHGFGGTPGSVAPLADAFAGAGFEVESPLLAGHGTSVADLATTGWADWLAGAEQALARVASRSVPVIVAGQSMGGSLAVELAARSSAVAGIVCVNAPVEPQPAEMVAMVEEMVAAGEVQVPAGPPDLADPSVADPAYDELSLPAWLSLMRGLGGVLAAARRVQVPALVVSSRNDHTVDPSAASVLAASLGGPVERLELERGYHVAALDLDREVLCAAAVEFARRVLAARAGPGEA